MRVFLSWSGERSGALAQALEPWLKTVLPPVRPWLSTSVGIGKRWSQELGHQLEATNIGVFCVTPENQDSPWLLFEAGAVSKALGDARVCPLLLGMAPEDLEGPLRQFQACTVSERDVKRLVYDINRSLGEARLEKEVLDRLFAKLWPDLEEEIAKITQISLPSSEIHAVVRTLQTYGLPRPAIGRLTCFEDGFESQILYEAVCSLAQERLYIFGRKNRKLFDKEHWDFFAGLAPRIAGGFDFRCLFLGLDAPESVVQSAHADADFPAQLKSCHQSARSVLARFGVPHDVCRTYRIHRDTALIVVDNAVLFTPTRVSAAGAVQPLTKCHFEVVDVGTALGGELVENFLTVWNGAEEFRDDAAREQTQR